MAPSRCVCAVCVCCASLTLAHSPLRLSQIFIVLELITGGELFDKIVAEGRFSEDKARFYLRQLVSGVQYCHSQSVCHRYVNEHAMLMLMLHYSHCMLWFSHLSTRTQRSQAREPPPGRQGQLEDI